MASSGDERDEFADFQNVDRTATKDQQVLYFATALFTVVAPIYLYLNIFDLVLQEQLPVFGIVTAISAFVVNYAYQNVANSLKTKLLNERERHTYSSSGKSKGKKRDGLARSTNRESMAFAILYNNVFFYLSTLFLAFVVFRSSPAAYNYVLSVGLSATLLSLSSSSSV